MHQSFSQWSLFSTYDVRSSPPWNGVCLLCTLVNEILQQSTTTTSGQLQTAGTFGFSWHNVLPQDSNLSWSQHKALNNSQGWKTSTKVVCSIPKGSNLVSKKSPRIQQHHIKIQRYLLLFKSSSRSWKKSLTSAHLNVFFFPNTQRSPLSGLLGGRPLGTGCAWGIQQGRRWETSWSKVKALCVKCFLSKSYRSKLLVLMDNNLASVKDGRYPLNYLRWFNRNNWLLNHLPEHNQQQSFTWPEPWSSLKLFL